MSIICNPMEKRLLNRIKSVLADRGKTNEWLAKKIKKSPTTVSRWSTNNKQPSLEILAEIADLLEIDIHVLIHHTRQKP
ncbi:MAG TPA: helix-turn-helix transcriptional regulator [Bacteroidia bacterium]|nr:helix-turn-helix transcriptional regulator [Bacteroidia bacterium]